ncbi:MAG TPA: TMEM175 family protein, partial [Myxococcaceae bacterium]|nr:TMEM175 family protein [Myxococcaceae bacterium]
MPGLDMSTGRLLALGDGIFAIAMTLLVFEVKVPEHAAGSAELRAKLFELWPRFASCGLGFLTLGYAWIGHHNQYVAIRRTDRL